MAFTIEIMCNDDGTYQITNESAEQESAEGSMAMGAEEAGEPQGETVRSVKDVMLIVMDMLKNKGQVADATNGVKEDQFAQGFAAPGKGGELPVTPGA